MSGRIDYSESALDEVDDLDVFEEAIRLAQEEVREDGNRRQSKPNPGPQTQFLASKVDEILFGGQAGGGKSFGLTAMPLRWINVPGFYSITFRRERPQLVGLMKEGVRMYGLAPKLSPYIRWDWPGGVQFRLAHCARLEDAYKYQGQEFHLLNIDELTHILLPQYDELVSRVRGNDPRYPMRIRCTTNPGGIGHAWVFERWGPWLNPEFEHPLLPPRYDEKTGDRLPPAKPGEPLWVLATTEGEDYVPRGTPKASTRAFIPSRLEDNPALLEADPHYEQRVLSMADPVRRRQLRFGDWLTRYAPGLLFKQHWCELVESVPEDACMVRFWDLAALDPKKSKIEGDPDWVAGVLLACRDWVPLVGVSAYEPVAPFTVVHVTRFRDTPKNIIQTIQKQSALDRATCRGVYIVGVEEEGGSAGKFVADAMLDALKQFHIEVERPTGDKVSRFGPFSGQAEYRRVALHTGHWPSAIDARTHWLKDYCYELESFPSPDVHDDQVDGTSGAFKLMTTKMASLVYAWRTQAARPALPTRM